MFAAQECTDYQYIGAPDLCCLEGFRQVSELESPDNDLCYIILF
jgi:hypothetical protein